MINFSKNYWPNCPINWKNPVFGPFWALFSQFLGKKSFPENRVLSRTYSYEFLAPCQISEKTNDTIPRKRLDRRKDGQTLFYRTLLATAGGLIKSVTVEEEKCTNLHKFALTKKLIKYMCNYCVITWIITNEINTYLIKEAFCNYTTSIMKRIRSLKANR